MKTMITKHLDKESKVLIDTSVWSLALRKREKSSRDFKITNILESLISIDSVVIIGCIRQELLSGISSIDTFNKLKIALNDFPDLIVNTDTYIKAAECFNICRTHGIQGSHIDFLICAVSITNQFPIFTLDKDFDLYSKYIDLNLYKY